MQDVETLEGTLERVVFQNRETQWTVARVKVSGQHELATVVGSLLGAGEGAALRLHGRWATDPKYGRQFRVTSYQTLAPATLVGIEKYLGSAVPGIGPELAKRIVAAFGLATLEIIQDSPERLMQVAGIGRTRVERIAQAWVRQREVQDVMVFLQGHGISPAFAQRVLRRYGSAAMGIVKENPYRLALDVPGIGFRTADTAARSLGIERTSPARAEAGLLHVLGSLTDEGHAHVPEPSLLKAAETELEVGAGLLVPALERLAGAGRVVREHLGDRGTCASLHPLWQAEVAAAARLGRLLAHPKPSVSLDCERALAWFEAAHGIQLAAEQRKAVAAAVREKVVVVTGGPGVGKTTIVNAIIRILEKRKTQILLGAPTGRAAKRMAETTGRPAATLHRLLEFEPKTARFGRDEHNPLSADLIIIDEASMIDVSLFAALLAAVPPRAQLILVGDVDQLPSVGPGRVLADVIASQTATVVRLTEIFRQAARSAVVVNAHRINRGEMPELHAQDGDFYFITRETPEEVQATILEVVAERIPRRFGLDALHDVQVLTPMNRGEVGTHSLNAALQARLNPVRPDRVELSRGGRLFREGDKVIQLRNDYTKDVFNGDVGRVAKIGAEQLVVDYEGRPVPYDAAELDDIALAYALSVHKAQGSEYPAVVLPVVTQHYMLLQRNLLYTAITRAKRLVVVVGSHKALAIAVRNDETQKRWTWLARRIQEAAGRSG